MPHVYTIEGARRQRRRRRRRKGPMTAQQRKFRKAAKECAGLSQGAFRRCMKDKLR